MKYAVRFSLPNESLSWWNYAFDIEQLGYSIKKCFEQYPNATIHITEIKEVE